MNTYFLSVGAQGHGQDGDQEDDDLHLAGREIKGQKRKPSFIGEKKSIKKVRAKKLLLLKRLKDSCFGHKQRK